MTYKYAVTEVSTLDNVAVITASPIRKALRFIPGQYASVGFTNGGRPSPMRCFSIIGGPQDGTIRFAVRILGPFSRAMARLQAGDVLRVKGPFGKFYIDQTDTRAVMIASGIGITPFLSMLQDLGRVPATLLYSNRSAQSIPFYDELCAYASQNPNLQIGFFASDDLHPSRQIVPGRISDKYMQKITGGDYAGSTYFICGPSKFSREIESALLSCGVSADRILCESFTQKMKSSSEAYGGIRRWTYGLSFAVLAVLFGGIMVLDLSRAVPRLASQQIHTAQVTNSTGSAPVQRTPTYYQPPMSSVS